MRFRLVKEEPSHFSFANFAARGSALWDGIRHFQARNHLRATAAGDALLRACALVRQGRLSAVPRDAAQHARILELGARR
jgi:predicted RNA-binding protein with PUA-like domain